MMGAGNSNIMETIVSSSIEQLVYISQHEKFDFVRHWVEKYGNMNYQI